MNCSYCGKSASVYFRAGHWCWTCWETGRTPRPLIHIDYESNLGRYQLCTLRTEDADPIYHMTPQIAAAFVAQHLIKACESVCPGCLQALGRDFAGIVEEAKTFAATLKSRRP